MATLQITSTNHENPKHKSKTFGKNKRINQQKDLTNEIPISLDQIPDTDNNNEQSVEYYEPTTQQQLQKCAEFLNKTKTLQYVLETDLIACDAKWTLFVAAALSYRYDSVLIPFPPQFATEQSGYNIDSLISVIYDTPKLRVILQNLMEQNSNEMNSEVIDLLYWVLVEMREPALRLIEEEELYSIVTSIDEKCMKFKPTHAFEINSLTGYHSEVAFRNRTLNLPLKLAFMGSKFDNIFSILQNGFLESLENKNPLELTTDLQTSLHHSPNCAAWGASQCGSIIACTAICEFALNTDEDKIIENKNDRACVDIHLCNPSNIRLRYLLFYGRRFPRRILPRRNFWSWIYNHKYSLSLMSYMLFLVSIGIANSGSGETFKFYVSKKIDLLLDFWRRIISKEPLQ